MSVNWVTLDGKGRPVPLPNEQFIFDSYNSSNGSSRFPAVFKTVASQNGSGLSSTASNSTLQQNSSQNGLISTSGVIECSNGYIYLSTQRFIYVTETNTNTNTNNHCNTHNVTSSSQNSGFFSTVWNKFSDAGIVGPSTRYHVKGLGDMNFDNISIPLSKFSSARIVQPWVGPNGWAAVFTAVKDGGLEPQHLLWEVTITFSEGGGVEFAKMFEKAVRACRMNQNHIDELPAYTAQ